MPNKSWKELDDSREKYKAYLCSSEWKEKRQEVIKRAKGVCERCGLGSVEEVHHTTYDRLYDELLDDLQGLCESCHRFTEKRSEFDPAGQNVLRTPPRSLEAERALLVSMLLMNEVIDDVIGIVSPQSFYGDANRRIAAAIFDLYRKGTSGIDAVTVTHELARRNELDGIGGPPYLMELLESHSSPSNGTDYAKIVQSKATQRAVIYELSRIVDKAYFAEDEEVLAEAERAVFALSDQRVLTQLDGMESIVHDTLSQLYEQWDTEGHGLSGLSSGFRDLDNLTTGFRPGELIILAARPSMGKTALACNIVRSEHSSLIFSLEQSRTELCERLICIEAGVNSHHLRSGSMTEADQYYVHEASNQLSKSPLAVDDSGTRTVAEMRSMARRLHRKQGLKLIIVDYLQLIQPEDTRVPREQQVATITRQLKCLAKELQVPLIALSQLNRGVEQREDKRPRLSDLRESGAIEQDADMVMFLHRPEAYNPEDRPGEADLIVAKHRNGPIGSVKLAWRKETTRFENYEGVDIESELSFF